MIMCLLRIFSDYDDRGRYKPVVNICDMERHLSTSQETTNQNKKGIFQKRDRHRQSQRIPQKN